MISTSIDRSFMAGLLEKVRLQRSNEQSLRQLFEILRPRVYSLFADSGLAPPVSRQLTFEVLESLFEEIATTSHRLDLGRRLAELAAEVFLREPPSRGLKRASPLPEESGWALNTLRRFVAKLPERVRYSLRFFVQGYDPSQISLLERLASREAPDLLEEAKRRLSQMHGLLSRIRQELPAETAYRYRGLLARRDAETLSPVEHEELLRLSDEVELWEAERLEPLVELARFLGIPPRDLIQELDLPNPLRD
jgi:hypothetical protein